MERLQIAGRIDGWYRNLVREFPQFMRKDGTSLSEFCPWIRSFDEDFEVHQGEANNVTDRCMGTLRVGVKGTLRVGVKGTPMVPNSYPPRMKVGTLLLRLE